MKGGNLEIGQLVFGNPVGEYTTPEYVDAFIDYILSEIERVYWNTKQKEWDRHEDPEIKGVVFNPYYWGENEKEAQKPNLSFSHTPKQEIRWYKHSGRGQSSSLKYSEVEWVEWFDKSLSVIRESDLSFD
jgi:hypothetical protein